MLTHSTVPGNCNLSWKKHKWVSSPPPSQILLGPLLWALLHKSHDVTADQHTHTRTHAHACKHTQYTHSPLGLGKPTLPPKLLRVLCFSWLQVINWITQAVTVSCPYLYSLHNSATGSLVSAGPQKRSPVRFLKSIKYYTSAKWGLSKL